MTRSAIDDEHELRLVRAVAPEVLELVPATRCPVSSRNRAAYLECSSHSRPTTAIHLAVYEVQGAAEDLWSLGWEWTTEIRWDRDTTWTSPNGGAGGDALLMWVPSAYSWKLMWSEQSGRVVATAYADDVDELVAWWGRSRVVASRD